MAIKFYGLKNCDTCTKARQWLVAQGIDHEFVDLRADGVGRERLADWLREAGRDALINTRSRTWRELEPAEREIGDDEAALNLLMRHPTLIKRPVLEPGTGGIVIGFSATRYEVTLAGAD